MSDEKKQLEEVTLVDEETYLHLKETVTKTGIAYEAYDKKTGTAMGAGLITWEDMLENPIRSPLACARRLAMDEIGLRGEIVSRVALRTLEKVKEARRSYLRGHKNDAPDHSIRFITSSYDELFRIPDGGTVKVQYPDRSFIAKCEYVDDYHTRIGTELFHICQFAEILEKAGATVQPEPEIFRREAAWQLNHKNYLSIQECDDGWDYSLYEPDFRLIDGGRITDPSLTILEARDQVLSLMRTGNRTLTEADYGEVAERTAAANERILQEKEKLDAEIDALAEDPDDFCYDFDLYGDEEETGRSVLGQLRDRQKESDTSTRHVPAKPKKEECL